LAYFSKILKKIQTFASRKEHNYEQHQQNLICTALKPN